ncbi:MAG: glycosyltransferase [Candidatus Saccharibacteria bacterium]|nr:glycosyltransferase [Candidatus Saccharibacteria bacterium]
MLSGKKNRVSRTTEQNVSAHNSYESVRTQPSDTPKDIQARLQPRDPKVMSTRSYEPHDKTEKNTDLVKRGPAGRKILIATAVYHPMVNGVAVFSHNLALGLAKRGNQVLVVCPSQTGKSYEKEEDGVRVCYLKSVAAKVYPDQIHKVPEAKRFLGVKWPRFFYKHGFRVSLFPAKEISRILDEFRPDIVHIQVSDSIGLSVASYARKHKIPIITTEHNQPEVITEPLKVPKVAKKPLDAVLRAYFINRQSKSDFVTMPTEKAISDLLLARGREFPVPVMAVSNGVDLAKFKPGLGSEEIYKKYKISKETPIVLYVGRVDPEKEVGKVIRAYEMAVREVPEAKLLIVGDGVDKVNLEKMIKKRGLGDKVKFLGRITPPDLYELYRVGSVFVTASEVETQGIVLIEAAATGLPLVAVDAGAVGEICRTGENGFLCQPGNIKEMSEGIRRILTDKKLRDKFSKKSIILANEHDLEKTIDKFIAIYDQVIKISSEKD